MPQYKKILSRGIKWFYKFGYEGRIYRSNAIYLTKQEAKKAEMSLFKELEKQTIPNKDIYLYSMIEQRLKHLASVRSTVYCKNSTSYLDILKSHFGNILIKKIAKIEINNLLIKYSNELKSRNKDNYSVNELLKAIKSLFNYGINYLDLNIKNPCIGLQFFPVKQKMKYIPSDIEINTVLESCNSDQKLLIEFVRDTGCRISEALNLKHKDILQDYVILHTRKSKNSNLVPRKVPRPECITTFNKNSEERYFSTWEKEPKFLPRKANGKWGWHNLRHRYASLLSKQGTPIFNLMSLLGHSNMETTQRYLQLLP